MQLFNSIVLAAAAVFPLVSSLVIEKRANDVTVTVAQVHESKVKISITNNGAADLSLLKAGSFLDSAPVYKATVFKDGVALPFTGILLRTKTTNLPATAFESVGAGKTVDNTIDLAAVHDMSAGGVFEVIAEGAIPVATAGSTKLSAKTVRYQSNKLSMTVDPVHASNVEPAIKVLNKRTIVSSCSGDEQNALISALADVTNLANAAADAALNGDAGKFNEYFMTTDAGARQTVSDRLAGVAAQGASTTDGTTSYYCDDIATYCDPNVLAYTLPSQNLVANCPIYYSDLPHLTTTCHGQDQVTTSIHEFTHAPATYSPGTADNAYGYAAATALSSDLAINNADTYALYSGAINLGC